MRAVACLAAMLACVALLSRDALAQATCPPNAHVAKVERDGDVRTTYCDCDDGYKNEGGRCVRALAPPDTKPPYIERGLPLVDCAQSRDGIARLSRLLAQLETNPTQRRALERAEALARQQTHEIARYDDEMRRELLFYGLSSLGAAAQASKRARAGLEAISAKSNLGAKAQAALTDAFERLDRFERRALGIVGQSSNGRAFVVEKSGNVIELWREPLGAEQLLQVGFFGSLDGVKDSVLVVAGQRLSALVAGPFGEAAFEAANFAIAYSVLNAERDVSAAVRLHAEQALAGLESVKRDARYRIQTLQRDLDDVAHGQAACVGT